MPASSSRGTPAGMVTHSCDERPRDPGQAEGRSGGHNGKSLGTPLSRGSLGGMSLGCIISHPPSPPCGTGVNWSTLGVTEVPRMKIRMAVFTTGVALGALWALAPFLPARAAAPPPANLERATFAGGCFWCMEASLEKVPGVVSVVSGYAGGSVKNPTYEQVGSGTTGHAESVQVTYDPARLSYERLVEIFWRNVDPTDGGGQFCDRGGQYRTAIFYADDAQKRAAEGSKRALEASGRLGKPIVTEIVRLEAFYPAEDYHQDFYKKNPVRYTSY